MYAKFSLLALIVLIQISCAEIADKSFVTAEKNIPSISPMPEKIINQPQTILDKSDKAVIYWESLDRVYYDDEHGKVLGSMNYGYLVYRKEAVSPQGLDQIENNQDIPQSLIDNFKEANKTPERLFDRYPGTSKIRGFSGNRDLAKFYEAAKRKDPETKAVVCFSNIGIDDSYSQALVYGEFYRPDKGLIKFYFQMNLEIYKYKLPSGKLSGVESYKMFQITETN